MRFYNNPTETPPGPPQEVALKDVGAWSHGYSTTTATILRAFDWTESSRSRLWANQRTTRRRLPSLRNVCGEQTLASPVDPERVIAKYPECADELREYFAGEELLGNALGQRAKSSKASPHSVSQRETAAPGAADSVPAGAASFDHLPVEFGRYRVLKVLGQGAMGAVYLAHDTELGRDIALKTPKLDASPDSDLAQRFLTEARSAAALHHRNICPVYDVGEINGVSFLTMAYIDGRCLDSVVSEDRPLPGKQAALVVRKLALGLQEAHANGVIHRDLKPANVMIDSSREPVVMDFGLARQLENTDQSRLTNVGTVMGSPAYMSPEQVSGELDAVGPSADIYSLGVILFELLSGHLPYEGSMVAILAQIVTADVPDVRDLRSDVDVELAGICSRMIAKNPSDRYSTMQDVAEALSSWLRKQRRKTVQLDEDAAPPEAYASIVFDEPPVADKPPSRPRKATRRQSQVPEQRIMHPATWIATGLVAAFVLLTGLVFLLKTPYGTLRVDTIGDFRNFDNIELTVDGTAVNLRQSTVVEAGEHELSLKVGDTFLPFDLRSKQFLLRERGSKRQIEISVDDVLISGKIFTVAKNKVTFLKLELVPPASEVAKVPTKAERTQRRDRKHDVAQRTPLPDGPAGEVQSFLGHESSILCLAFSPDGQMLASGSRDETVRIWDVASGQVIRVLTGHSRAVAGLAFHPDGSTLVSGASNRDVKFWDVRDGREIRKFTIHSVCDIAISPDGMRVATGGFKSGVATWNFENGQEIRILRGHTSQVSGIAFSPDGGRLASVSPDKTVRIWDTRTGGESQVLKGQKSGIDTVAFSPINNLLATGNWSGNAIIWNVDTAEKHQTFRGAGDSLRSVAFSPDGRYLLTGGSSGNLGVWHVPTGAEIERFTCQTSVTNKVAVSPDGRFAASGGGESWDGVQGKHVTDDDFALRLWRLPKEVWSPHETESANDSDVASVVPHSTLTDESKSEVHESSSENHSNDLLVQTGSFHANVSTIRFSRDGQSLVSMAWGADIGMQVFDVASGRRLRSADQGWGRQESGGWPTAVAVSPVESLVVGASSKGRLMLWDHDTGHLRHDLKGHTGGIHEAVFAPSGKQLLTSSADNTIRLWDVTDGVQKRAFDAADGVTHGACLDVSPDGQHFAEGGHQRFCVRSLRSGKTIWKCPYPQESLLSECTYSDDGKRLATISGGKSNRLTIHDAANGNVITTVADLPALQGAPTELRFLFDDRLLLSTFHVADDPDESTLLLWNAETGRLVHEFKGANTADISADGTTVVTKGNEPIVRVWRLNSEYLLQPEVNDPTAALPPGEPTDLLSNTEYATRWNPKSKTWEGKGWARHGDGMLSVSDAITSMKFEASVYPLTDSYSVEVELEHRDGAGSFYLSLPIGKPDCVVFFNASIPEQPNTVAAGLHYIDNKSVLETGVAAHHEPFQSGRPVMVRIDVDQSGDDVAIAALVDTQTVFRWSGAKNRLSPPTDVGHHSNSIFSVGTDHAVYLCRRATLMQYPSGRDVNGRLNTVVQPEMPQETSSPNAPSGQPIRFEPHPGSSASTNQWTRSGLVPARTLLVGFQKEKRLFGLPTYEFWYDSDALTAAGIDLKRKIRIDVSDGTDADHLRAICDELDLQFRVDGNTVRLFPKVGKHGTPIRQDLNMLGVNKTDVADTADLLRNSIGMNLKLIPAGVFLMGSPESEVGRSSNEPPQHRVPITQPFYLQTTEVTQKQWKSVMGPEWNGTRYVASRADYPATHVSWEDAVEFCAKLSKQEDVSYRLPTEAEWQYACRAGTQTSYSFGDDAGQLGKYAWYRDNTISNNEKYAHPVAQKRPNRFGLYDMHGNVWEWCSDWYHWGKDNDSPSNDAQGHRAENVYRVYCGGGWPHDAPTCRSARRYRKVPSHRNWAVGFRVARSATE